MSTVIKAKESGPILKRLSTVDLADHLAEARAVVEAAQRRAAQTIADAEVQVDSALEEARKSGHDAGYKQGYAEGTRAGHQTARDESIQQFKQEHGNIVADFQRAISEIDSMKQDLQIQAEKGLLDFAVLVATKLTFMIGRMHRESAVENVKRAIRLVGSKSDVTIRIHSRDIAAMEMFADSVIKRADAWKDRWNWRILMASSSRLTPENWSLWFNREFRNASKPSAMADSAADDWAKVAIIVL